MTRRQVAVLVFLFAAAWLWHVADLPVLHDPAAATPPTTTTEVNR